MAEGNGHAPPVPHRRAETVVFMIGGASIEVPVLNLDILDRKKDLMRSLDDNNLTIIEFGTGVLEVIADLLSEARPELTLEVLRRTCSWEETKNLVAAWNSLLQASGFGMGEAEAASPGTGMSTDSPPNLEPGTSLAATLTP